MKIAIISGSVREGRNSRHVAQWVATEAAKVAPGTEFDVVALADFDLPVWNQSTIPGMLNRQYADERQQRWSDTIAQYDGYILVTPEYNHGVPGPLKNAFDSLASEWMDKPIAFVSYGADGGVRATEQWRQVVANFNMFDLRATVALSLFDEFGQDGLNLKDRREAEIAGVITAVSDMTAILVAGKAAVSQPA